MQAKSDQPSAEPLSPASPAGPASLAAGQLGRQPSGRLASRHGWPAACVVESRPAEAMHISQRDPDTAAADDRRLRAAPSTQPAVVRGGRRVGRRRVGRRRAGGEQIARARTAKRRRSMRSLFHSSRPRRRLQRLLEGTVAEARASGNRARSSGFGECRLGFGRIGLQI